MPSRIPSPRIAGRQIDTLFTGLAISMVSFGWFQLFDRSGALADYQLANWPAGLALLGGLLIVASWAFRKRAWLLLGLQMAVWVMAMRLVFIAWTQGIYSLATGLTLGWTLMVLGVWMREAYIGGRAKSVEIATTVGG